LIRPITRSSTQDIAKKAKAAKKAEAEAKKAGGNAKPAAKGKGKGKGKKSKGKNEVGLEKVVLESNHAALKYKDKRTKLTELAWASFDKAAARQKTVVSRRISGDVKGEVADAVAAANAEDKTEGGEEEEEEEIELTISSALGALSAFESKTRISMEQLLNSLVQWTTVHDHSSWESSIEEAKMLSQRVGFEESHKGGDGSMPLEGHITGFHAAAASINVNLVDCGGSPRGSIRKRASVRQRRCVHILYAVDSCCCCC
jgi:hypothetical protein